MIHNILQISASSFIIPIYTHLVNDYLKYLIGLAVSLHRSLITAEYAHEKTAFSKRFFHKKVCVGYENAVKSNFHPIDLMAIILFHNLYIVIPAELLI